VAINQLTPDEIRARREEREAREAREQTERNATERNALAALLIVAGVLLLIIGVWYLVLVPGEDTVGLGTVVNLQRLYIGQTAAIVGGIFFAAGLHERATR
jgi:polyferredoxin